MGAGRRGFRGGAVRDGFQPPGSVVGVALRSGAVVVALVLLACSAPTRPAEAMVSELASWPDWLVGIAEPCCSDRVGYAVRLDGSGLATLLEGGEGWGQMVPSPDGTRAGFMGLPNTLYMVDLAGGTPRAVFDVGGGGDGGWAWSPDGSRVAVSRGRSVFLADPDTGRSRLVRTFDDVRPAGSSQVFEGAVISSIRWAAASDRLAVGLYATDGDGQGSGLIIASETVLMDADGARVVRRGAGDLTLSPDGSAVAWQVDGTRRIASSYDLSNSHVVEAGVEHFDYWPLRWSPAGARAAWIEDGGERLLVAGLGDPVPQVWLVDSQAQFVSAWVTDQRVGITRSDGGAKTVVDVDRDGRTRTYARWSQTAGPGSIEAYVVGVSGDGHSVVIKTEEFEQSTGRTTARLWVASVGADPRELHTPASPSGQVQVEGVVSARVGPTVRFGGVDRADTAVQVSKASMVTADTVVIARGDAYPDALAGAPLAGELRAPLLLSGRSELPATSAQQIERLQPSRAVVLGTTDVVGAEVEEQLRELGVDTVQRIGGATRFHTAADLARTVGAANGEAFLVLGVGPTPDSGWADAVAASGLAARTVTPVLLTHRSSVPDATLEAISALELDTITIVGGEAAVSRQVESQVRALGVSTRRLAGADRFATSIAVADHDRATGGDPTRMWAVTGTNWPDALAAGPAAAAIGGVVVLVPPSTTGPSFTYVDERDPEQVVVVGGVGAISRPTQRALAAAAS